MTKKLLRM